MIKTSTQPGWTSLRLPNLTQASLPVAAEPSVLPPLPKKDPAPSPTPQRPPAVTPDVPVPAQPVRRPTPNTQPVCPPDTCRVRKPGQKPRDE
jgi:hypothetical protein